MSLRAMQTIYNSRILHQPKTSFAIASGDIQNVLSIPPDEISHTIGQRFAHSFSLRPDARFCHLTKHHKDGLLRIGWALNGRSLALISGKEGSGKSTMLLRLAQKLESTGEYETRIVRVPLRRTTSSFSHAITGAAGLPPALATYENLRQVAAYAEKVYRTGRRLVLLIDDGDRLTKRMLGVLHSLAVATVGHDLAIGMVLVGSTRLERRLGQYPAVLSRVGARLNLESLTYEEMREMIEFRHRTAGTSVPKITETFLQRLHRLTGGNPARIVKAQLTLSHR